MFLVFFWPKRYRTAAESALYSCYRASLTTLRERGLRTIAIYTAHSAQRGFPADLGAHIVLRTIRRFLEKQSAHVDRIVLALAPGAELDAYAAAAPLYFPRSEAEQHWALPRLPKNIGDSNGEPVIEERRIPIASTPLGRAHDDDDDDHGDAGGADGGADGGNEEIKKHTKPGRKARDGGSPVNATAAFEHELAASPFTAVVGDHDAVSLIMFLFFLDSNLNPNYTGPAGSAAAADAAGRGRA
jgi:hypothetical protein